MKNNVEKRIVELERLASRELKAVVSFENGEKKRLPLIDVTLASWHGARGDSPKVTSIEWINKNKGTSGILPQIAEHLKYNNKRRIINGI